MPIPLFQCLYRAASVQLAMSTIREYYSTMTEQAMQRILIEFGDAVQGVASSRPNSGGSIAPGT